MQILYNALALFILLLFFTACNDSFNNSEKRLIRNSASVYGSLPKGETTVIVARDDNGDGYVDNQEFSHPIFISIFNEHYTVSEVNASALHAIRFSRLGYASITQDLVAGTQEINIESFAAQYRSTILLAEAKEETSLVFSLTENEDGFSASAHFKEPVDTSAATSYFQMEIPFSSLKKSYRSISAVFDM